MKRIFPVITILIFLSLLGLIFFQYLWIKSARDAKDKQVEENIKQAMENMATTIESDEKSLSPVSEKPYPNRSNAATFLHDTKHFSSRGCRVVPTELRRPHPGTS